MGVEAFASRREFTSDGRSDPGSEGGARRATMGIGKKYNKALFQRPRLLHFQWISSYAFRVVTNKNSPARKTLSRVDEDAVDTSFSWETRSQPSRIGATPP